MSEQEQKRIFSKNLKRLLNDRGLSQIDVANAIGVSPQTFNTWIKEVALPRMSKVQALADYFKINKSDLLEEKISANSEIEISFEEVLSSLSDTNTSIMFSGKAIDDNTRELLLSSLQTVYNMAKEVAKSKKED